MLPTPTVAPSRERTDKIEHCWSVLKDRLKLAPDAGALASDVGPMALDLACLLPRMDQAARRNAMRCLDAYLTVDHRQPWNAQRAQALEHQAPVWQQLVDALPHLKGDRSTQYAILFRLHRTVARQAMPAPIRNQIRELLAPLTQSLQQAACSGGLGANCGQIAGEVLSALGCELKAPAKPRGASRARTLSGEIGRLPPMTANERLLYQGHLNGMLVRLNAAREGGGAQREIMPALIYSLNKHLPGLNAKVFGFSRKSRRRSTRTRSSWHGDTGPRPAANHNGKSPCVGTFLQPDKRCPMTIR